MKVCLAARLEAPQGQKRWLYCGLLWSLPSKWEEDVGLGTGQGLDHTGAVEFLISGGHSWRLHFFFFLRRGFITKRQFYKWHAWPF